MFKMKSFATARAFIPFLLIFSNSFSNDVSSAPNTYSVPTGPAFDFLNTSPSEISRPGSVQALKTDIANAISPEGSVQQGIAVDFAPWSFIDSWKISLSDYQTNSAKFAAANTQISFATIRSATDSGATQAAVGIRITLFDHTDPLADKAFTDGVFAEQKKECAKFNPTIPAENVELKKCLDAVYDGRSTAWKKNDDLSQRQNWNKSALTIGAATGVNFSESKFEHVQPMGFSAWLAGSLAALPNTQLLYQAKFNHASEKFLRADFDSATPGNNSLAFTGQGTFGSAIARGYLNYTVALDFYSENKYRVNKATSGGFEFRIQEGLWASTGVGKEFNAEGGSGQISFASNLKWNLSSESRLAPKP
jgi:hypothetical protein